MTLSKRLLVILSCLSAWVIFGMGLMAPLTPSEGTPGPVDLTVFLGVPLVLFIWSWFVCSAARARVLILLQIIIFAASSVWLLSLQFGWTR
jgi:hypothetical protein